MALMEVALNSWPHNSSIIALTLSSSFSVHALCGGGDPNSTDLEALSFTAYAGHAMPTLLLSILCESRSLRHLRTAQVFLAGKKATNRFQYPQQAWILRRSADSLQ